MSRGFNTKAAQTWDDALHRNRSHSIPIDRSVTYESASADEHRRLWQSRETTFYQRFGHPTTAAAADKVAQLEGADAGLVFGSGMGAISTALMSLLSAGDHVVAHRGAFDQTRRLLQGPLSGFGVASTFVDARDPANVQAALRPDTRLVYVDSPSNPLLDVIDIRAMANLTRPRDIDLVVDSTFASPFLQQPLSLGATLVVHSATKFLGGHSDVMCGAVAGNAELIDRIRATQTLVGTILDPQGAWLLLRGIKTLGLRVERQCASALAIAQHLVRHVAVAEVRYPWLEGTDDLDLARRQMRGGGGVVTFRLVGGRDRAAAFIEHLQIIRIATSLGGVESVIELPYDLDFEPAASEAETSAEAELLRGYIRLSVGVEELDDLLRDLDGALRS